jgi:hypothetical protein
MFYNVTRKAMIWLMIAKEGISPRIDILCKPESSQRCEKTLENRVAPNSAGVEAEALRHRDRLKMIDHRAYVSPALLIDDVRVAGRIRRCGNHFCLPSGHDITSAWAR